MKITKLYLSLIIVASSTFFLSACSLFPASVNNNISLTGIPVTSIISKTVASPASTIKNNSAEPIVGFTTKYGQIVIKLDRKNAPSSVANFIKKVQSGFYNGLTFHRVEPGFVVQGGDPLGNGTGGGSQKSEINSVPFVVGSVGLARGPDRNITNDSQFFICLTTESCSSLTGDYVNIGSVISGMDVVSKIVVGDKILQFTDTTK